METYVFPASNCWRHALSHACAHSLSNAQGAVSIKACMYSRTLWKYIVFQPMSASSHCYCPGGHVSNSVHWVVVAAHVSRASRFALGGATPETHRCWVVALVGGTPHRTHTLPGICVLPERVWAVWTRWFFSARPGSSQLVGPACVRVRRICALQE